MDNNSTESQLVEAMVASRDARKQEIVTERQEADLVEQEKKERVRKILLKLKAPFNHMVHAPGELDSDEPNSEVQLCPMCGEKHEVSKKLEKEFPEEVVQKLLRNKILGKSIRIREE